MSDELDLGAAADAFARHLHMEEIADYARRGRRFARLAPKRLEDLWVEMFRVWATDTGDVDVMAAWTDLDCEFALRGGQTPEHRIRAERAALGREFKRRYEAAMADPALKAEMTERFRKAFTAFAEAIEEGMERGN